MKSPSMVEVLNYLIILALPLKERKMTERVTGDSCRPD